MAALTTFLLLDSQCFRLGLDLDDAPNVVCFGRQWHASRCERLCGQHARRLASLFWEQGREQHGMPPSSPEIEKAIETQIAQSLVLHRDMLGVLLTSSSPLSENASPEAAPVLNYVPHVPESKPNGPLRTSFGHLPGVPHSAITPTDSIVWADWDASCQSIPREAARALAPRPSLNSPVRCRKDRAPTETEIRQSVSQVVVKLR